MTTQTTPLREAAILTAMIVAKASATSGNAKEYTSDKVYLALADPRFTVDSPDDSLTYAEIDAIIEDAHQRWSTWEEPPLSQANTQEHGQA